MTELPEVAVIVPVRDGAATIGRCVDALLGLDYPAGARTIVVVDNGSTDGTRALLAGRPVTVVREDAVQSSYAARNRGVAATTAPLLAFTDADCEPAPGWLAALVAPFADPDVGGVAGRIEPLSSDSPIERYQARHAIVAERAFAHPVLPFAQTANAAYRRTVFARVGGFEPRLVFGGDLDFSWRMQREAGLRLAFAPDALVRHRHRTTSGGLFRLYQKNAIANCLLARRYPHYGAYPRLRTAAWLGREVMRSSVRDLWRRRAADADPGWIEALRRAGELSGWMRWHCGALPAPARELRS